MRAIRFLLTLLLVLVLGVLPCASLAEEIEDESPAPDENLRQMQLRLKELGYFYGDCNGLWSEYTQIAVENFQKANSLIVTGTADSVFADKLNGDNAINKTEYLTQAFQGEVYETGINPGDSGKGVKRLQTRLTELNYFQGKIDGKYDDKTQYAVKLFQLFNGLTVSGVADPDTLYALTTSGALAASEEMLSAIIKYGDEGTDVKRLQLDLKEMGYFTGDCSGKFGRKTQEALNLFQKANGLEVTGECNIDLVLTIVSGEAMTRTQADEIEATKLLILGDDDPSVCMVKSQLNALGYYTGEMGSLFTQELAQSVSYFQEANQISPTGIADTATRVYLNSGAGVGMESYKEMMKTRFTSLGDANYAVQLLQTRLSELGYYTDSITGVFDKSTQAAVMYVQRVNMLMENGEADEQLLNYIYSPEALPCAIAEESYNARLEYNQRRQMIDRVCETALKCVSAPYEGGKVGPDSFGNAGLVYYCFDSVDVRLEPTVMLQLEKARARLGWNEDVSRVEEGQQVFYRSGETILTGIYVGDRIVVYASATKGMVIAMENMAEMEEYEFVGSVSYF